MHDRPEKVESAGLPSITTVPRNDAAARATTRKSILKTHKQGWNLLKVGTTEAARTVRLNLPISKNKTADQYDCETRRSSVDMRTFDPATNRDKIITKEVEIRESDDFHGDFLRTLGCESRTDFTSKATKSFSRQKGYTQRVVDEGKAHLRASLWPMLRDGDFYITQTAVEKVQESQYGIDPACRCGRHDRHM